MDDHDWIPIKRNYFDNEFQCTKCKLITFISGGRRSAYDKNEYSIKYNKILSCNEFIIKNIIE